MIEAILTAAVWACVRASRAHRGRWQIAPRRGGGVLPSPRRGPHRHPTAAWCDGRGAGDGRHALLERDALPAHQENVPASSPHYES
jgi:hypothetical protein